MLRQPLRCRCLYLRTLSRASSRWGMRCCCSGDSCCSNRPCDPRQASRPCFPEREHCSRCCSWCRGLAQQKASRGPRRLRYAATCHCYYYCATAAADHCVDAGRDGKKRIRYCVHHHHLQRCCCGDDGCYFVTAAVVDVVGAGGDTPSRDQTHPLRAMAAAAVHCIDSHCLQQQGFLRHYLRVDCGVCGCSCCRTVASCRGASGAPKQRMFRRLQLRCCHGNR
mmetsp:Transcript_1910/g.3127  ORF Transcript_1910/g.3127 Transcript_1910/m.3127 type:complete len:223 (+) Transcript_1910:1007-1675(+)